MKIIFVLLVSVISIAAQPKPLQAMLDAAVAATFDKYPGLKKEELAITAIDLKEHGHPMTANYRGDAPIYPASVIKLFYLEAAHRWMEDGKIKDTPELRRAMKDMIVLSYNEATHYVLDVLTDTTSGPELPTAEMEKWSEKRNAVNRYFASRGYEKLTANQKPWWRRALWPRPYFCRSELHKPGKPLLRRMPQRGCCWRLPPTKPSRPTRSRKMLELLARDPAPKEDTEEGQCEGIHGRGFGRREQKLWSKAGWTSNTRHDAALVQLPGGKRFILVTFTLNHASDATLIPFVAKTRSARHSSNRTGFRVDGC